MMPQLMKSPPMTAAERQRECRARKRGASHASSVLAGLPAPVKAPALPAPAARVPAALPAPAVTAIQKAKPAATGVSTRTTPDAGLSGETIRLSLPPAVAARLQSLLDRHHAGTKPLTAAERAEAEGLIDIAEYFVVQRMRNRLAA